MRWLLDTNVWIDAHAGRPDACRVFAQGRATPGGWISFSAMTRLEALGFSAITGADDKALRELLAEFEEVAIDSAVIEAAIRLRRQHKLKSPDAIIAASALLQGAILVSRNLADFKRIAGLTVLDTQSF